MHALFSSQTLSKYLKKFQVFCGCRCLDSFISMSRNCNDGNGNLTELPTVRFNDDEFEEAKEFQTFVEDNPQEMAENLKGLNGHLPIGKHLPNTLTHLGICLLMCHKHHLSPQLLHWWN